MTRSEKPLLHSCGGHFGVSKSYVFFFLCFRLSQASRAMSHLVWCLFYLDWRSLLPVSICWFCVSWPCEYSICIYTIFVDLCIWFPFANIYYITFYPGTPRISDVRNRRPLPRLLPQSMLRRLTMTPTMRPENCWLAMETIARISTNRSARVHVPVWEAPAALTMSCLSTRAITQPILSLII